MVLVYTISVYQSLIKLKDKINIVLKKLSLRYHIIILLKRAH